MNIKEIVKNMKNIDKKVLRIVQTGIKFSFVFCLIASFLLVTYTTRETLNAYYIGMSLFKSSLFFIVGFIACGVAFNSIMKEIQS
ncbi:MAG: hypothetical protein IKD76_03700 [Clostridia bacterium]|nr:hypothetical protein [Clostridia bacterium]